MEIFEEYLAEGRSKWNRYVDCNGALFERPECETRWRAHFDFAMMKT
jgi:hypothetical protein